MGACYVTAMFTALPGKEEALLEATLENIPKVRSEQGCIRYDLHRSVDNPEQFLFYESWESRAALAAHARSPHMLAYANRVKELRAGESDVRIWEAIKS